MTTAKKSTTTKKPSTAAKKPAANVAAPAPAPEAQPVKEVKEVAAPAKRKYERKPPREKKPVSKAEICQWLATRQEALRAQADAIGGLVQTINGMDAGEALTGASNPRLRVKLLFAAMKPLAVSTRDIGRDMGAFALSILRNGVEG